MKMRKKLIYLVVTMFVLQFSEFSTTLSAQETIDCKVLIPELAGSYKGECKKGLANGIGEATGKDFYSGEFKNGLPHGQGLYKWANGDSYKGDWKKGKMEGLGEMKKKVAGPDSIVTGYWIDNDYIGKEKTTYTLNQKGTNIVAVNFIRLNGEKNEIEIGYYKNGKPVPAYNFGISELLGRYGNIIKSDYAKTLIAVTYPFRAEVTGGAYFFDFTINQRGKWRISVNVTEK